MTKHLIPSHAIEQFIRVLVASRRHERNTWVRAVSHRGIVLADVQRQRKLQAKKIGAGYTFVHSGDPVGGTLGRLTTLASDYAYRASQSAKVSSAHLDASGVPYLARRTFLISQAPAAAAFARSLSAGYSLRRIGEFSSSRIVGGTSNGGDFGAAWGLLAGGSEVSGRGSDEIEVAAAPDAIPLRVYVVGERLVAGVVRLPLHVVGDGRSTIEDLVEDEYRGRQDCGYLRHKFPVSEGLWRFDGGLAPSSVPGVSEVVVLSNAVDGPDGGGTTVDILESLSDHLVNLAVDAMWAFPGLSATAVDILTPSLEDTQEAVIAAVIPDADISEFVFPTYGERRRVGRFMLEHMVSSARRDR